MLRFSYQQIILNLNIKNTIYCIYGYLALYFVKKTVCEVPERILMKLYLEIKNKQFLLNCCLIFKYIYIFKKKPSSILI